MDPTPISMCQRGDNSSDAAKCRASFVEMPVPAGDTDITGLPSSRPPLRTSPDNNIEGWIDGTSPVSAEEVKTRSVCAMTQETESLRAFCPLCFSCVVAHPVLLHHLPEDGGAHHNRRACIACLKCVETFRPLLSAAAQKNELVQCPVCNVAYPTWCEGCSSANGFIPLSERMPAPANPLAHCFSSSPSTVEAVERETCGVCEEMPATHMCLQCDFSLCDACRLTTHNKGRFRLHEILSLREARERCSRKCSTHPKQILDLYCHTCEVSACVTCCFGGEHNGHHVAPLAEVAATTRESLQTQVTGLCDAVREAETMNAKLEGLLPMYDDCMERTVTTVHVCFDRLREALVRREAALLGQLREAHTTVRSSMTELLELGATMTATLKTWEKDSMQSVGKTDSVTLMHLARCAGDSCGMLRRTVTCLSNRVGQTAEDLDAKLAQTAETDSMTKWCPMASFSLRGSRETHEEDVQDCVEMLGGLGLLDMVTDLCETSPRTEASSVFPASCSAADEPGHSLHGKPSLEPPVALPLSLDKDTRRTMVHAVRGHGPSYSSSVTGLPLMACLSLRAGGDGFVYDTIDSAASLNQPMTRKRTLADRDVNALALEFTPPCKSMYLGEKQYDTMRSVPPLITRHEDGIAWKQVTQSSTAGPGASYQLRI